MLQPPATACRADCVAYAPSAMLWLLEAKRTLPASIVALSGGSGGGSRRARGDPQSLVLSSYRWYHL